MINLTIIHAIVQWCILSSKMTIDVDIRCNADGRRQGIYLSQPFDVDISFARKANIKDWSTPCSDNFYHTSSTQKN
jgi:hypothetical protein